MALGTVPRGQEQEDRHRRRSRSVHAYLLRAARPHIPPEEGRSQGQGRRPDRHHRLQRRLCDECLGQGQRCQG